MVEKKSCFLFLYNYNNCNYYYFYYSITWIIDDGTIILLQESVTQCYNVIQDIAREEYESVFNVSSSSITPVNVLDEHFVSLESEKTNAEEENDFKRRKITEYGNTFQFSHFHQC